MLQIHFWPHFPWHRLEKWPIKWVSLNYSRIGAVWLANWCGIVNVKLWTFLNNWGQSGDFFGNDSENGDAMFERTNKFLVIKISTWAAQSVATSNRLFYSSKLKKCDCVRSIFPKKIAKKISYFSGNWENFPTSSTFRVILIWKRWCWEE